MNKLKVIIWVLFLLFFFKSAIISLLRFPPTEHSPICKEYSQEGFNSVLHQRDWSDLKTQSDYCVAYELDKNTKRNATSRKNQLANPKASSYPEFWGEVYRQLSTSDEDQIKILTDSLELLASQSELNLTEFAHVVVKMVQDIPYQYVTSGDCTSEHSDHPCYSHQRYGITSPIEFLYTLKGDCDSRTVLIYTILRYFNYNPVVLISKEYRHSMLALNIPATGEFIKIEGEKYYFWETTGEGWEPGIIPPGMRNKNYWNIALKHEL